MLIIKHTHLCLTSTQLCRACHLTSPNIEFRNFSGKKNDSGSYSTVFFKAKQKSKEASLSMLRIKDKAGEQRQKIGLAILKQSLLQLRKK